MLERVFAGYSLRGVLHEHFQNQVLLLVAEVLHLLVEVVQLHALVVEQDLIGHVPLEELLLGQNVEQDNTRGEHVNLFVVGFSLEHLRSYVPRRPTPVMLIGGLIFANR